VRPAGVEQFVRLFGSQPAEPALGLLLQSDPWRLGDYLPLFGREAKEVAQERERPVDRSRRDREGDPAHPVRGLPRQTAQETLKRWQFKPPSIPVGTGKTFLVSAMAVATAYTHGAVIPSLGAQVAHDLVRSTNVLAIVAGVVGILARRLSSRFSMSLGAVAPTVAMVLLVVSVTEHGLLLFLLATATAGVGYSLLFLGGLQALNAAAPSERRGGTLSMLYLVAYLAMGTGASLLGVAATAWGLTVAIDLGASAIILLCGVTVVLVVSTRASCASVIKPMMRCALAGPRPAERPAAWSPDGQRARTRCAAARRTSSRRQGG